MQHHLQERMNQVQGFFAKWGFKLSAKKSVAVCFTHSRKFRQNSPKIHIGGYALDWSTSVRFLGVIFDSKLNWGRHIDLIVKRCKQRLNVMRLLTSLTWGCNKQTLMLYYRCSIRSVIEYGCEAFDSASSTCKGRLDRLQHAALRTACGSMTCTGLAALQVECGDPPLDLRRKMLIANFATKTKIIPNHPAREIFEPVGKQQTRKWKQFFHRYCFRRKQKVSKAPMAKRVSVLNEMVAKLKPKELATPAMPPWKYNPPHFDEGLVGLTKEDPTLLPRALELLDTYRDHTRMYTDASKIGSRVAVGGFVPRSSCRFSLRVTDDVSIFTAELTAIKKGMEWMARPDGPAKLALFTDSYSSVLALKNSANANKSPLVASTLALIDSIMREGREVTVIWVPSHVGITSNEAADRLAKCDQACRSRTCDRERTSRLQEGHQERDNA